MGFADRLKTECVRKRVLAWTTGEMGSYERSRFWREAWGLSSDHQIESPTRLHTEVPGGLWAVCNWSLEERLGSEGYILESMVDRWYLKA